MGAKCCSNEGGAAAEKSGQIEQKGLAHWSDQGGFPPDSAVQVTILGAKNIRHKTWDDYQGPNGAYVVCEIPGKAKTTVQTPPSTTNSCNPMWDFEAVIPRYEFPDALLFMVYDCDNEGRQQHLGKAQLFASKLEDGNGTFEGLLPLACVERGDQVPMLNVKIEAVPRPGITKEDLAAKEPSSLEKGRFVRIGIRRKGRPLGLRLLKNKEEGVFVKDIYRDGAAAVYNREVRVREQLQVGDRIIEANGLKGIEAISKELSSEHIELLVECRSYIFKVNFQKPANRGFGIALHYLDSSETLRVGAVEDGAVQDYNKTVPVEEQVHPEDHILGVNGLRDPIPEKRLEQIKNLNGNVYFLIRRVSALPKDTSENEEGGEEAEEEEAAALWHATKAHRAKYMEMTTIVGRGFATGSPETLLKLFFLAWAHYCGRTSKGQQDAAAGEKTS